MATIRCILDYDSTGLVTTYQIAFDNTDKIELVTLKNGINLKGNGSSGVAVRAAVINGGTAASSSQHSVKPGLDVPVTMISGVDYTKFGTLTVTADELGNFNLAHLECSWQTPNGATLSGGTRVPEPPLG